MATQLRQLDIDVVTRRHLDHALDSLCQEFGGTFSRETIERYVVESLEKGVRRIRDGIAARVRQLADELAPALAR
jgi:hypothetical protein